jgi:hypothetical protein
MAPPVLTDEQRAAALARAAEVRRLRAELKQLLKTGSVTFSEILERSKEDPAVAGMKVYAVLSSLPGTGKVKAKRMMETYGIAESRRLRGLGGRQRAALLDAFD